MGKIKPTPEEFKLAERPPIPKGLSEEELCVWLQDYPWVPAGMTEEECISILREVSYKVAPRYRFGYNDDADMGEQGILLMIMELKRGKFKPRGDKPLAQQLRNFLRVWIGNRISNYRRNKSCRYASNPDSEINKSKYNLMHPLHYVTFNLQDSDIFARDSNLFDNMNKEEITARLLDKFDVYERKLYLQYMAGVNLTLSEELVLFSSIRKTLGIPERECD